MPDPQPSPPRPIPVSLVITDLDPGGAEHALVSLATRLDRSSWSPQVISLSPPGALVQTLLDARIPVENLSVSPRRPLRAIRHLAAALRHHRPRLIQSFLFHANVSSRLARPFAGWPLVLGGIRVAEREKRWHLLLERATRPLGHGAICVSQGVADFMHSDGGWPRHALDIIPNGIDLHRLGDPSPLDRATLGLDPDAVVVLFAGRIEPQKDLPTLLDAARLVARSRPTFRLLLAGEGPNRPDLMALTAADPDLSRALRWLGFRADLPRLMATADLLVLPSLWEGMPNVVLEAMATGLPVVATNVEGSRDLVLPGQTGWLVPPGDPTPLSLALLEAHDRRDLRNRYGRTARTRVRTEFSLDKMVASYESRWTNLLGLDPQSRA